MEGRPGPRGRTPAVLGMAAVALMAVAIPASANHQSGWVHDHSSAGIPFRPHGYSQLVHHFGQPCNARADDARSYFPSAVARGQWGYVYYHPYIFRTVAYNVLGHIGYDHRFDAVDYGVYGYNCRAKTGGSGYSVHSWGAAIDTNTARNPYGQSYWNGRGSDGVDYGRYIPAVYRDHNFQWGLAWSDPHHFQYVTGY